MTTTTAHPLTLAPVPENEIPEALKKDRPVNSQLAKYKELRDLYQWQIQLHGEWINFGTPVLLERHIGKVVAWCLHCGKMGHTDVNCPELRGK